MFSDKLINLLSSFTRSQRGAFRRYLQSPYLNPEAPDAVRLYDYILLNEREGADLETLKRELVWAAIYADKKYNDAALRRLLSDLLQLALHFLALEIQRQDPVAEDLHLQRALESTALNKHLGGVERRIEQKLAESEGFGARHYLNEFRFRWNIFERASRSMGRTHYIEKLLDADESLDRVYIVQKLKAHIAWLVFRGFRQTEVQHNLPPGFWEYANNPRFSDVPLIAVYLTVIQCLTEPDEEAHFRQLLSKLEGLGQHITREDLRECYHIAQNYCAFKINQGKSEYSKLVFQIFKQIIAQQLLLEDNQLSESMFKNIVTVSLGQGEYAFAEQFIETWAPHLPASVRENARTFNLSHLYFYQKRYAEVIRLLANVEYKDVSYALGSKLTLLRTYYELDEYQALDSLLDSFRIYLRRNRVISNTVRREYVNYLSVIKKLSTLAPDDRQGLARLREKFLRSGTTMPKKWLLEKMDQLGKTRH
ncbi:MAG: hypothetical protein IT269_09955 [Saprospiraceae bacterium]|nr:hypothetical protein [Saprospiraceae bacterium]